MQCRCYKINKYLEFTHDNTCLSTERQVKPVSVSYDKKPNIEVVVMKDVPEMEYHVSVSTDNEKDRLNEIYSFCVDRLYNYIKEHLNKKYVLSVSGGKDSYLTYSFYGLRIKMN